MPVYRLTEELLFPPPDHADPSGLLAVGGDLSADRLLLGYSLGIFPWYEQDLPILWHSPDPRMLLVPGELHVSRSLRRSLRRTSLEIRFDSAFDQVIDACARTPRSAGAGTWITDEMIEAYVGLFELGFAHSAEAWRDGELVGGLYGVALGGCFFGESMFAREADASKIAFATLVERLVAWDFDLIDCQVHTDHLANLGASPWPRRRFLTALAATLAKPTRRGRWQREAAVEG